MSEKITKKAVERMLDNKDFSAAEGHVPELLSVLMLSDPKFIKSVVDVACENVKIKKDIIKYTHEAALKAITAHSEISKIEVENYKDINTKLSTTLENFSKKEELSKEEIEIYLTTLRMIETNTATLSKRVDDHERFVGNVLRNEQETITTSRQSAFWAVTVKILGSMAQSEEGREFIGKGIYVGGRALYNVLSKIYR